MCCIFTCCGWVIDLIQRLWTFTMSCCISSAVCCVMVTSSMSGIALGYNYSLAEYIDLKETNVSIYLKRGVFDDEIADDMDWRRSGRLPVAGQIGQDNLMTGAPADEVTSLRSGRRLDDSVFDADDQNKYEGSLMKLTAKPPYRDTPRPQITGDSEMAAIATNYPSGSLNQMKAIQGLIDSRRAMATGGTTLSPIATYNVNFHNQPKMPMYWNPGVPSNNRRMMEPGAGVRPSDINPARLAVPDQNIGSGNNWVVPKRPDLFNKDSMPDYYILSPTYPPPITLNLGPVRTTEATTLIPIGAISFATRTPVPEPLNTKSPMLDPDTQFNEKFLLDKEVPSKSQFKNVLQNIKMGSKTSEEEYEDEIKGLPVRKRRNVIARIPNNTYIPNTMNITNTFLKYSKNKPNSDRVSSNYTKTSYISSSIKDVTTTQTERESLPARELRSNTVNELASNNSIPQETKVTNTYSQSNSNESNSAFVASNSTEINHILSSVKGVTIAKKYKSDNNFTNTVIHSNDKVYNASQIDLKTSGPEKSSEQIPHNKKSDREHDVESINKHPTSSFDKNNTQKSTEEKRRKTLLNTLVTSMKAKESVLVGETTQKTNLISAKRIKIQTRRNSFESKIVSSKYITNTKPPRMLDTKQTTISTAEILNSISISLNEAGLLRNPASSTFVKLIQSTFT